MAKDENQGKQGSSFVVEDLLMKPVRPRNKAQRGGLLLRETILSQVASVESNREPPKYWAYIWQD